MARLHGAFGAIVMAFCLIMCLSGCKLFLPTFSFLKLTNDLQTGNVPWVNVYQIPSRNLDPIASMGFVCRAYVPSMAYNEIFENLLL